MCGGGGGGDGGAAEREKERQAKIAQGYEQIKKIFDGYATGTGEVANYQPNQTYYTQDGTAVQIRPTQVANPNYRPVNQRPQARGRDENSPIWYRPGMGVPPSQPQFIMQDTAFAGDKNMGAAAGKKFYSGVQQVPGFDDAFFAQREQAYKDFALPQLDDQYTEAQEKLMYALARAGRLKSSTRGERAAELQQDYDIQKTNVADKARQYMGDARSQVENARADLVALNSSIADPNAIASQSRLASESLKVQQAFDPLAPLFQNVTEGIATQADLERRNQNRYSTGIFVPSISSGSGRSVRY